MYAVFRTAKFDKEIEKEFSKAEIQELENYYIIIKEAIKQHGGYVQP